MRADLRALAAMALLLVTALAYRLVGRAGFVWDDDAYVVQNALLTEPGGLGRIWSEPAASPQYYPVVFSSFWLEARLWGSGPETGAGYHLTNLALHGATALLLWGLLGRLLRPREGPVLPGAGAVAYAGALLFALHPVGVESVAWVSERKNVLSAVFALLAARAWVAFSPPEEDLPLRARDWRAYALALAAFALALLSKSVTATLPGALLVLCWWRRGRVSGREVLALAPFILLGAVAGLHTAWLEAHHVGAGGGPFRLAPAERLVLAGRAPWEYLRRLALPLGLSFYYPRFSLALARGWPFVLGTPALLVGLWAARRQLGRGPLAATLVFGGTLFPVLGFVDVYPFRFSWIADHFQYHAMAAALTLAAAALAAAVARLTPSGPRRRLGFGLALGALAGALSFLTQQRARAFEDYEALLRDTLSHAPDCWIAHANLAQLLAARGEGEQAFAHLARAVALEPRDERNQLNLGRALLRRGRAGEAVRALAEAVRLNPRWPLARFDLTRALLAAGRPAEAARVALELLREQQPGLVDPALLGLLRRVQGALRRGDPLAQEVERELGVWFANPWPGGPPQER
ncbi:MAG: tetratricopeptide repeat protein [Planctomycetota bacterium]